MLLLLFLSMAVSLDVALCQTCARSNCKKTVGNLVVQYASFTKVPDVKFASWTANETVSVTGNIFLLNTLKKKISNLVGELSKRNHGSEIEKRP